MPSSDSRGVQSRRRFLLATAGAAALAGCVGGTNDGTATGSDRTDTAATSSGPTGTATAAPLGSAQPVDGTEVTVETMAVQSSLRRLETADSMAVAVPDDWFVVANVQPAGTGPDLDAFTLSLDGRQYAPVTNRGGAIGYGLREEGAYRPDDGGWVTFEVPGRTPSSARLACGDATWRVPDAVRTRLSDPRPSWTLGEMTAPDELTPGETFSVGGPVENTGEVTATFRGVLNVSNLTYASYPYTFGVELDPGERGEWRVDLTAPSEDPAEPQNVGFDLRTPAGDPTDSATFRGDS